MDRPGRCQHFRGNRQIFRLVRAVLNRNRRSHDEEYFLEEKLMAVGFRGALAERSECIADTVYGPKRRCRQSGHGGHRGHVRRPDVFQFRSSQCHRRRFRDHRSVSRIGVRFGDGAAYLNFNPNLGGANEDEQFLFTVTGGLDQIDLSVGGNNATVTERACANPISLTGPLAALCTDSSGANYESPLGQITVASGAPDQPVFSSPFTNTSPVYIFKDIETGANGQLSEFTQSFEPGTATPEPFTMLLLGSGLLGLGLLRRRAHQG